MFEKASRKQLRFNTPAGSVSVERLWQMKISDLIALEDTQTEVCEKYVKTTRRKSSRTAEQQDDELRLEILTYIIDTLEKESLDANEKLQNKEHNQKIMALIAKKEQESLENLSLEELSKLLK